METEALNKELHDLWERVRSEHHRFDQRGMKTLVDAFRYIEEQLAEEEILIMRARQNAGGKYYDVNLETREHEVADFRKRVHESKDRLEHLAGLGSEHDDFLHDILVNDDMPVVQSLFEPDAVPVSEVTIEEFIGLISKARLCVMFQHLIWKRCIADFAHAVTIGGKPQESIDVMWKRAISANDGFCNAVARLIKCAESFKKDVYKKIVQSGAIHKSLGNLISNVTCLLETVHNFVSEIESCFSKTNNSVFILRYWLRSTEKPVFLTVEHYWEKCWSEIDVLESELTHVRMVEVEDSSQESVVRSQTAEIMNNPPESPFTKGGLRGIINTEADAKNTTDVLKITGGACYELESTLQAQIREIMEQRESWIQKRWSLQEDISRAAGKRKDLLKTLDDSKRELQDLEEVQSKINNDLQFIEQREKALNEQLAQVKVKLHGLAKNNGEAELSTPVVPAVSAALTAPTVTPAPPVPVSLPSQKDPQTSEELHTITAKFKQKDSENEVLKGQIKDLEERLSNYKQQVNSLQEGIKNTPPPLSSRLAEGEADLPKADSFTRGELSERGGGVLQYVKPFIAQVVVPIVVLMMVVGAVYKGQLIWVDYKTQQQKYRINIAEELYKKGLSAMAESRVQEAVLYLKRAVSYNQQHEGARKLLVLSLWDISDQQMQSAKWHEAKDTLKSLSAYIPQDQTVMKKLDEVERRLGLK